MAARLGRLKTRPEFLRVAASGHKASTPGLVLQAARRPESTIIRYGLTASRKVGGAVARNRARRRLRALAEAVLPQKGHSGIDYVLICRAASVGRDFAALKADLLAALARIEKQGLGDDDAPGR